MLHRHWAPLPRAIADREQPPVVVGGEVHFTMLSLGSLKVTCLLGLTRLGEAAHLLSGSSGQSAGKTFCSQQLLWLLFQEHPLLPEHWWLLECPWFWCHPWETEQFSWTIYPLSIAAAASTQQWASLATLRASSQDSCCQVWKELKWSHIACIWA